MAIVAILRRLHEEPEGEPVSNLCTQQDPSQAQILRIMLFNKERGKMSKIQ